MVCNLHLINLFSKQIIIKKELFKILQNGFSQVARLHYFLMEKIYLTDYLQIFFLNF